MNLSVMIPDPEPALHGPCVVAFDQAWIEARCGFIQDYQIAIDHLLDLPKGCLAALPEEHRDGVMETLLTEIDTPRPEYDFGLEARQIQEVLFQHLFALQ